MRKSKHIRSLICTFVIAVISIGMLAANITETSALSEEESQIMEPSIHTSEENSSSTAEGDTSSKNDVDFSEDKNDINSPDLITTEEGTNGSEETINNPEGTTNNPSLPDLSGESDSSNSADKGNEAESSNSTNKEETDSPGSANNEETDSPDSVNNEEADFSDSTGKTTSESTFDSDFTNSEKKEKESSESQKVVRPLDKAPASSDRKIHDNHLNTTRILSSFSPSRPFPDESEKIKYNVSLPIEGIPSFITQEMIVGALKCQDETGFPASVTIAQIIQESGYGYYGEGGENGQGLSYLAYQYCNLFGIKGEGPAGTVDMLTNEQTFRGTTYTTTAGFRVYNTYTECIEDRTEILRQSYSDLTKGVTDANTFAMKIGSRWATSRSYSQNLIEQMERYDLYRLDEMTLDEFSNMIGQFADPCPGAYKTSGFGYRAFDESFHKGIDLGTGSYNLPTYAAEAGTVIKAGYDTSAGNWIVIDHGNGLITKYMHHKEIYVEEGQHVEKGQQIGLTGNTGYSTGNHLHFQVEENGSTVDPTIYLSE